MANEIFYNGAKFDLATALFDWATVADARIRVMLLTVTGAVAQNPDTDDIAALLAGAETECSGTGYSRKDLPAAGRSVTEDDTNDRVQLEAADVVYSGADFNDVVAYVVYYDSVGTDTDATNFPIAYGEQAAEPNGGDLTLAFPNGVARHT